jgi:hypothetical protein
MECMGKKGPYGIGLNEEWCYHSLLKQCKIYQDIQAYAAHQLLFKLTLILLAVGESTLAIFKCFIL